MEEITRQMEPLEMRNWWLDFESINEIEKKYVKCYIILLTSVADIKMLTFQVALRIRPLGQEEKSRGIKCVAEKVDDKVW